MREYKIKRGHDADVGVVVSEYFGVKGVLLASGIVKAKDRENVIRDLASGL